MRALPVFFVVGLICAGLLPWPLPDAAAAPAAEPVPPSVHTEIGASATPGKGRRRLAVLDVQVDTPDLDPAVGASISAVLAAELQLRGGDRYEVLSRNDLRQLVGQQALSQQMGCDTPSCFADMGQAAKADEMVAASIGKLGDEWVFTLQLIDVAAGKVSRRQVVSWLGDASGLVELCRPYAARLLEGSAAEEWSGAVQVLANEPQASVYVDDQELGASPVPILTDLPIGKHRLRLIKDGYIPFEQDLVVNRNETTLMQVRLIDAASLVPWYEEWWFWASVAAVVVGGAATGVALSIPDAPTTVALEAPLP